MDFSNASEDDFENDDTEEEEVDEFDFDFKLLKTKFRVRVKKNEHLKRINVPKEGVKNIEIDFYNFDERLEAFITSFPNLKSILFLATDDDFFDDKFIGMATKLPLLSKMDIRIWQKLDRFDYNEYDIEETSADTIYELMVKCNKLRQVKVLSKYDFGFRDEEDYNSVGSDKAKFSLENFETKIKTEMPRWKYEFKIPLIDHNGTGYSYSVKK